MMMRRLIKMAIRMAIKTMMNSIWSNKIIKISDKSSLSRDVDQLTNSF